MIDAIGLSPSEVSFSWDFLLRFSCHRLLIETDQQQQQ